MCSAWVRMHFVGSSTLTGHSAKSSVAGIVGPGRCPPLLYSLMSSPRQSLPLLGAIDPALGQPRRLCAAASLHATHPCTGLGLARQPSRVQLPLRCVAWIPGLPHTVQPSEIGRAHV